MRLHNYWGQGERAGTALHGIFLRRIHTFDALRQSVSRSQSFRGTLSSRRTEGPSHALLLQIDDAQIMLYPGPYSLDQASTDAL